mgnify:CR=1 FL=1
MSGTSRGCTPCWYTMGRCAIRHRSHSAGPSGAGGTSFRGDHAGLGENRYLSGGAGKLEWLADRPHPSCGAESRPADLPARRGRGPVGGSPLPGADAGGSAFASGAADRPGDESLGTELPFARHRAGADATRLPAPVAGGDRGLSWGHTDGGQRSGVRPEGRLLPEQRLQPAVHNRGTGKADGRACRLDDLPPLSLEHGPALPWDSRHTALPVYQSDELWSAAGEVAGRVLYDWDGETFRAPYHSLEADTSPYGYQGIYGQRDIFGTFSLSTAAQHGRGYVVYAADEIPHAEYRNVPDSRFNYSYPYRFLQYPAKTALENRMSDHGAFRTVWSDLRYGPEVTPPVIKKNDQRNDPPAKAGGSF